MRTVRLLLLSFVLWMLVGCDSVWVAAHAGWQGNDVHLVDGTWISTEHDCSAGDDGLTCRTTVAEAMRLIRPAERGLVVRARLAELPTTFVTGSGETRTARIGAGIMARSAVVLDLANGSRRVVGLWCHAIAVPTCDLSANALEYWVEGGVPPSYPPGTKFG